jgi:hypothetical protein
MIHIMKRLVIFLCGLLVVCYSCKPQYNEKIIAMKNLIDEYKIPKGFSLKKTDNLKFFQESNENIWDTFIHDFEGDGSEELYVIYNFLDDPGNYNEEKYKSVDCLYVKNHNHWQLTDILFSPYDPGFVIKNPASYFLLYKTDKEFYEQQFHHYHNDLLFIKDDGNNPGIGIYYIKKNSIMYGTGFTFHGYLIPDPEDETKIYFVDEDFASWSYPIPSTHNILENSYKKYEYTFRDTTGKFAEYQDLTPYLFTTLYDYKRKNFMENPTIFEFFALFWYCYSNNKKVLSSAWIDSHGAEVINTCPETLSSITTLLHQRLIMDDPGYFDIIDSWNFFENILCTSCQ